MLISGNRICCGGRFQPLDLKLEGGCVVDLAPRGQLGPADGDFHDAPVLPGFVDIHTHGGDMVDVNHVGSLEEVRRLSRFYASRGVTGFLVSVMTDTQERTELLLRIFADACERDLGGAKLLGIHLEGPFLSREYKGAMPDYLILDGDTALFDRYQKVAGGHIRYITIAPEIPGGMELIRHIVLQGGVTVAIGHSAAEYEAAVAAIEAGASASTHLFNAMKLFHMHRPAISGASLERDEVFCEAICDGFHLHPATIRLILKTKGLGRVVAISDSIMAAGLPDGRYKLGVNDVIVEGGDAKLTDGVRAGSTLTLDKALRNLMTFTGYDVCELSPLLSANAARLLGISGIGDLNVGMSADFVVMDENYGIVQTYVGGERVYEKGGNV
ncbi:MAG: N-acetylglucosamine-6-phosphate deacetylase [Sphaerochaetaceae bacterium]|nr:N-acetylglucosamine-6-phosphate deacetylase [Sphaerochaetaceae bacterium]